MFGWLNKWLLYRDLKKKQSAVDKVADDYLKDALTEHSSSMSLARKMQKANLLKAQAREVLLASDGEDRCPHGFAEDEDCPDCDDDGEPEPVQGILEKVITDFIQKKAGGQISPTADGNLPSANAEISPYKAAIIDKIKMSSDEELKKFIGQKRK